MFRDIKTAITLLLMVAPMSCSYGAGGCSSAPLQPESSEKTGDSSPLSANRPQAIINVTVRLGNTPVSRARIDFSSSIVGQAENDEWSATTDENGQARVEIATVDNVSGFFSARAIQNGSQIGAWSNISIEKGHELMFELPIGEEAQITGSSVLQKPVSTD